MPSKKPMAPIRFDNKSQIKRIRKAATLKKWSFNQFVVEAAQNAAELTLATTLTTEKNSGQLMVGSVQPTLNQ